MEIKATWNLCVEKAWLLACFIFFNCLFWRKLVRSCTSQPTLTCCPSVKEGSRWPCLLSSVIPTTLVTGWFTCTFRAGWKPHVFPPSTKPRPLSEPCQCFPFPVSRITCLQNQRGRSRSLPLPCAELTQSYRVPATMLLYPRAVLFHLGRHRSD